MSVKKRGYHHGDLRRELLDASLAIIQEGGLDSFSLRDVARRAGVSPAAPYHHFATKTELLAALAGEGFAGLAAAMTAARQAEADGSAGDRLRAIGEAYVRYALEHPAHFRLMFRSPVSEAHVAGEPADDGFAILLDAVREVSALPGVADAASQPALVLLAWSIVHGAASLVLDGPLARGLPELGVSAAAIPALVTGSFEKLLVGQRAARRRAR
jgi:AcrR family transcriptional regulator